MDKKSNAPAALSGQTGDISEYGAKVLNLSRIQRKVYNLLRLGGKYSVYDITTRLHMSDPRGHIASLRRKGIEVLDEWRTTTEGGRYKVYYINQGGQTV